MTVKERKHLWRKQIAAMPTEDLLKELQEHKQFHVFLDLCSIELGNRIIAAAKAAQAESAAADRKV